MKNYYAILEVPVGCPIAEIREAYRRLVQDNLWNKETFAELKEAYEVLTTPARRNEYDRATFGETFSPAEPAEVFVTSDSSLRQNARHCPMGAAAQCPVINARVPLQETYCPECGFLLSNMPTEFEPIAVPDPGRQVRLEDNTGRAYVLRPGINTIGREATDVLIPDKTVSRRHAQVEVGEDGGVTVEDLGSTNGTRIGGQVLEEGITRPVSDGDAVQFGSVEMRLRLPAPGSDGGQNIPPNGRAVTAMGGQDDEPIRPSSATLMPGSETAPAPPPTAERRDAGPARARLVTARGTPVREVPLVPGVTTIGRRAENTIILRDDPYVSGNHAQIIADEDTFRLTDLGSTNGTLINGETLKANEPHTLVPGDEIVIGGAAYRFERLGEPSTGPSEGDEDGDAGSRSPRIPPADPDGGADVAITGSEPDVAVVPENSTVS